MMKVETELATVKVQVEQAMQEEERCRNDDTYLIWKVLRNYTNVFIKFEDFAKLPSLEGITRMRRLIQNTEGRLKPTDQQVLNKRLARETKIRRLLSVKNSL